MRKAFIFLIMLIYSTGSMCFAEKLAVLPELKKPITLRVDGEQFYVIEGPVVSIYSLKNFKLRKKFGKAGEGPREFKLPPDSTGLRLTPYDDFLLINSMGRISFFSKDGRFQKELMTKVPHIIGFFQSFGSGFAGLSVIFKEKNQSRFACINLYDETLKKVKEIHRQQFIRRGVSEFPMIFPLFCVHGDNIFMSGNSSFDIHIFGGDGSKKTSIKRKYEQLAVTDKYKKNIHHYFRTSPIYRNDYGEIKDKITFSEHFPSIMLLYAADSRLYILTYREKDGKYETFVYGVDGTFKKRLFLPLIYNNGLEVNPHFFKNNRFYQLEENEETEQWELHAYPVE